MVQDEEEIVEEQEASGGSDNESYPDFVEEMNVSKMLHGQKSDTKVCGCVFLKRDGMRL